MPSPIDARLESVYFEATFDADETAGFDPVCATWADLVFWAFAVESLGAGFLPLALLAFLGTASAAKLI